MTVIEAAAFLIRAGKGRGVVGLYAEALVESALHARLAAAGEGAHGEAGYDAVLPCGSRVQVKGVLRGGINDHLGRSTDFGALFDFDECLFLVISRDASVEFCARVPVAALLASRGARHGSRFYIKKIRTVLEAHADEGIAAVLNSKIPAGPRAAKTQSLGADLSGGREGLEQVFAFGYSSLDADPSPDLDAEQIGLGASGPQRGEAPAAGPADCLSILEIEIVQTDQTDQASTGLAFSDPDADPDAFCSSSATDRLAPAGTR